MTGCHRIPASLYPRETTPWCQCGIRLRRDSGCNQLRPAGSPALSSTTFSGELLLHKSLAQESPAQAPLCFQEHQSKKSISHLTAQTVVLLTNSSHVSPMTPGSSSRPQMTRLTGCSVQKPRLCPCFLSSSHVPDPAETGWDLGPFARVFAMLASGHTSPGAREYEVTIRD